MWYYTNQGLPTVVLHPYKFMAIFDWITTPLICLIQNWSPAAKLKPVQTKSFAWINNKYECDSLNIYFKNISSIKSPKFIGSIDCSYKIFESNLPFLESRRTF